MEAPKGDLTCLMSQNLVVTKLQMEQGLFFICFFSGFIYTPHLLDVNAIKFLEKDIVFLNCN